MVERLTVNQLVVGSNPTLEVSGGKENMINCKKNTGVTLFKNCTETDTDAVKFFDEKVLINPSEPITLEVQWEEAKDAPKDGTEIIIAYTDGFTGLTVDIFHYDKDIGCWTTGNYFLDNDCEILGWITLPKLPKKFHLCKKNDFVCEETERGKFQFLEAGFKINNDPCSKFITYVNFCPICGEKANE